MIPCAIELLFYSYKISNKAHVKIKRCNHFIKSDLNEVRGVIFSRNLTQQTSDENKSQKY